MRLVLAVWWRAHAERRAAAGPKMSVSGAGAGASPPAQPPRSPSTARLRGAQVVAADTNGAGDTFATAYMLALAAGARDPGAIANWAAGRAVAMPQACKPGCVRDAVLAGSRWARWGAWQRSLVRAPSAPARARPPSRVLLQAWPAVAGRQRARTVPAAPCPELWRRRHSRPALPPCVLAGCCAPMV